MCVYYFANGGIFQKIILCQCIATSHIAPEARVSGTRINRERTNFTFTIFVAVETMLSPKVFLDLDNLASKV